MTSRSAFAVPIEFRDMDADIVFNQARLASTTAWIASPAETVELLDELESAVHPQ